MVTLEELEKRVKTLESMLFNNEDLNENGNTLFKTSIKYIVFSKDEKRVLSHNGFKAVSDNKDYTIKLFNSKADAKEYITGHRLYYKVEVKYKRIKVTYEILKGAIDNDC